MQNLFNIWKDDTYNISQNNDGKIICPICKEEKYIDNIGYGRTECLNCKNIFRTQ